MRIAVEPILLACCAVEVATALRHPPDMVGIDWVMGTGSRDVTVVVIAGTVTTAAVARVSACIDSVLGPRSVVAYGVCASSGGPYWDSHAVAQGWDSADFFVPGCPPPPNVLWSAIAQAAQVAVAHAAR